MGVNMVENNSFPPIDNLDSNIKRNLLKYITLRVDIKNFGLDNDIILLDGLDDIYYNDYPNWFCDNEGRGLLIQSYKGLLNINLKSIKEGNLKIALRSIYFLDNEDKKFPIYINIDDFFVNEKRICENKLVWHDEPYVFEKQVKDSEIINLKIKWSAMNENALYKNSFRINNEKLKKDITRLRNNEKKLKNENSKLKKEFNDYKEKNFNLMLTLEKIAKENYNLKKEISNSRNSNKKLSLFEKN